MCINLGKVLRHISVLYTYFWIVVYSYFYELKNTKHSQDREKGNTSMEEMQSIASSGAERQNLNKDDP